MNREFYYANPFLLYRKFLHACCLIGTPAFVSSCNIINPAEPIPAYVHVDSFSLSTNPLTQGSRSNKIVDVWASVDGTVIGAFEMPVTFPVLSSGSHTLTLRPGILVNGIAATRSVYPFYTSFDTVINFESGKTKTIQPHITYSASAKLKIEDFDQSGRNMVRITSSDTDITPVADQNSMEGKYGAVFLDNAHSFFECAWKDSFYLPIAGPAYVELNYKTENPFTVGVITYTTFSDFSTDIVSFKASQTWKKEYVNLGPVIANSTNVLGFKIYIKAIKNSDLSTASLFFDNIKVVY